MNFKFQTLGLILLLAILGLNSCVQQNLPNTTSNFNNNWQFAISDANLSELNNIEWQKVSLPHTAVIEPKVMEGQWQGICWYKKTFTLGKEAENKQLIFHFEGAMHASEFWVNGEKVASHLGGFLPVVLDFTHVAKINSENEIVNR